MTAGTRWIVAIVGLLGANVVAMGVLAVSAHHGQSQVIPEYYEQAVHYDDAIDQAAKNRALGWRVAATLAHGELVIAAADGVGASLDGAAVRVSGYPRAHADHAFDRVLVAAGPGRYRAATAAGRGIHDLTITVARGADTFVQRVALEAR